MNIRCRLSPLTSCNVLADPRLLAAPGACVRGLSSDWAMASQSKNPSVKKLLFTLVDFPFRGIMFPRSTKGGQSLIHAAVRYSCAKSSGAPPPPDFEAPEATPEHLEEFTCDVANALLAKLRNENDDLSLQAVSDRVLSHVINELRLSALRLRIVLAEYFVALMRARIVTKVDKLRLWNMERGPGEKKNSEVIISSAKASVPSHHPFHVALDSLVSLVVNGTGFLKDYGMTLSKEEFDDLRLLGVVDTDFNAYGTPSVANPAKPATSSQGAKRRASRSSDDSSGPQPKRVQSDNPASLADVSRQSTSGELDGNTLTPTSPHPFSVDNTQDLFGPPVNLPPPQSAAAQQSVREKMSLENVMNPAAGEQEDNR